MKAKYVYVDGVDWVGLFVDGKLVYEGHDISIREFAEIIGINDHFVQVGLDKGLDILQDIGEFPENLDEVLAWEGS